MNYSGWVRFYRKQMGHWVSEDRPYCKGYAWTYLYSMANWESGIWAKQNIKIERGQLISSISRLAKDWGWSRGKVRRFLSELETDGMIDIKRTQNGQENGHKTDTKRTGKYIAITIANYGIYQSVESKTDTKRTLNDTLNGQENGHNIRSKEYNTTTVRSKKIASHKKKKVNFNFVRNNKDEVVDGYWENITDRDIKNWEDAYPACQVKIEIKQMREWLISNPTKKKKNYRRFITNWLSHSQERGGTKLKKGKESSTPAYFKPFKEEKK